MTAREPMIEHFGPYVPSIGMAVAWAIHAMKVASGHGELKQRVVHLEQAVTDTKALRDGFVRLESKVETVGHDIAEIKDGLRWVTRVATVMDAKEGK